MESVRKYGKAPYDVAVVHGGPGAPGEMASVARELASEWGVLEPLQTAATLEGQVEELKDILDTHVDRPILLIGYSWGAWLSFIVAARYPSLVKKLILVSSGPFEAKYAVDIM
ncbi:MAG: alpha/beta fold hydrolase, partial [bacterium]